MRIDVTGLGLWAPGIPNASVYRTGGLDPDHIEPPCRLASSRAKRGTSRLARMLAEVFDQTVKHAEVDPSRVATVFGSAWGEIDIMVGLLAQIYDEEPSLSPMRFKHSVHNAASGLVSIATHNQRFSTALAAGHCTVEACMLEATTILATGECDQVVLAVGEDRLPSPLDLFSGHDGLALGFCLRRSEISDGKKTALTSITGPRRDTGAGSIASPPVAARWQPNPVAWALPLFDAVAQGTTGVVRLSGASAPWTVRSGPGSDEETR